MVENLIVSFCGLVGFLTVFLILLRYKSNRITNIYLVIVFLIVSTRMLIVGILNINNNEFISLLLSKYNNLTIVIIPCSYLYFKNLINDRKEIEIKNYSHFVIPLLFNLIDYILAHNYFNLKKIEFSFYIFFTIYTFVYFLLIFNLLSKNVWNREGEIGVVIKQNQLIRKWSIYFFSFLIITALRLIAVLLWELNNINYAFGVSYLWVSAIFWLILYFKIIISPEILYGYNFLNSKIKEHKREDNAIISFWTKRTIPAISNVQDIQLNEKIKEFVVEYMKEVDQFSFHNHAFRDAKFSITDLANKLNIPKSHLTFLFKYHSKISFPEYKKIVRIQDGLELIHANFLATNTYDSLAKKVGFTSYNTFFVGFKDVTGLTPQDYYIQIVKSKHSNP